MSMAGCKRMIQLGTKAGLNSWAFRRLQPSKSAYYSSSFSALLLNRLQPTHSLINIYRSLPSNTSGNRFSVHHISNLVIPNEKDNAFMVERSALIRSLKKQGLTPKMAMATASSFAYYSNNSNRNVHISNEIDLPNPKLEGSEVIPSDASAHENKGSQNMGEKQMVELKNLIVDLDTAVKGMILKTKEIDDLRKAIAELGVRVKQTEHASREKLDDLDLLRTHKLETLTDYISFALCASFLSVFIVAFVWIDVLLICMFFQ